MFRLVCYSVEGVINSIKNGGYIATDAKNNAYIINGFDKILIHKEVFDYVISNYNLTIGTI